MQIMASGHVMQQPIDMPRRLWAILNQCWSYKPEDRPFIGTIESLLAAM